MRQTSSSSDTGWAEPQTTESFGVASARGGIVSILVQILSAAVNFSLQIALARFLIPADFGLVAMASSFTNLLVVFRDAGATELLVNRHAEFDRIAGSVFWLALATSLACSLVTILASPVLVDVYHAPLLGPILSVMAIRFPTGVLGLLSSVKLTVELRWGTIGLVHLLVVIVNALLSLWMLQAGFGVFSIVAPPILGDVVRAALLRRAAGLHPPLQPRLAIIRSVAASSGLILITSFTVALRSQGDYIILGLLTSERETGLYFFAFTTASALAMLSIGGLSSLLLPVFAKLENNPGRRNLIARRSLHAYAAVGALPLVLQAFLARPLYRLIFGAKWEAAALLFLLLSLMTFAKSLNAIGAQLMNASGRFRDTALFSVLFAVFELAAFAVGALAGGALGVAWAALISSGVGFLIWHAYSCRVLGLSALAHIAPLWRVGVAVLPIPFYAWLAQSVYTASRLQDVALLLAVVLAGSATYGLILRLLWPSLVEELLSLLGRVARLPRVAT